MLLPRMLASVGAVGVRRTVSSSTSAGTIRLFRRRPVAVMVGGGGRPNMRMDFGMGGVRWATHKASRPANKGKDGPGKRLGAKKTAGEKVRIGTIIYRQRGTVWYAGENVGLGRDYTIYALKPGYVRYYKDPTHPKRKYIGVALYPNQVLPTPHNAATKRRLGREAVPLVEIEHRNQLDEGEREMLKTGIYYYRPPNWKLGLVQEPVKKPYDPKNTWARWQRRMKRVRFAKARRGIGGGKESNKPKKKVQRRM